MKILRNIYNQIGLVFVIIVAVLLYKNVIEFNWYTGTIIVLVVILILNLGKFIPLKKQMSKDYYEILGVDKKAIMWYKQPMSTETKKKIKTSELIKMLLKRAKNHKPCPDLCLSCYHCQLTITLSGLDEWLATELSLEKDNQNFIKLIKS